MADLTKTVNNFLKKLEKLPKGEWYVDECSPYCAVDFLQIKCKRPEDEESYQHHWAELHDVKLFLLLPKAMELLKKQNKEIARLRQIAGE
ncbi:hypothetical protein [Caudoviricetes sp.]|nr:hypothetical protein [Caudoviricetes sp.]